MEAMLVSLRSVSDDAHINSVPTGADIEAHRAHVGTTPLEIALRCWHDLTISKPGLKPWTGRVRDNGSANITAHLKARVHSVNHCCAIHSTALLLEAATEATPEDTRKGWFSVHSTISVIDTSSHQVSATIGGLGKPAQVIAFSAERAELYTLDSDFDTSRVDFTTNSVAYTIPQAGMEAASPAVDGRSR